MSSGEIRLDDNGVARLDLPVTLGAGVLGLAGTVTEPAFTGGAAGSRSTSSPAISCPCAGARAPQLIATARGTARLDARAEGTAARPAMRARLRPGNIVVTLRALPILPSTVRGGQIEVGDHAATVSALVVGVGVGAHAGVDATVGAPRRRPPPS